MDTPEPIPVTDPVAPPGEAGKRMLPGLVAVAFFMEALDTTILSTARPADSLHVDGDRVSQHRLVLPVG